MLAISFIAQVSIAQHGTNSLSAPDGLPVTVVANAIHIRTRMSLGTDKTLKLRLGFDGMSIALVIEPLLLDKNYLKA